MICVGRFARLNRGDARLMPCASSRLADVGLLKQLMQTSLRIQGGLIKSNEMLGLTRRIDRVENRKRKEQIVVSN